ncbi:MAG TPA: hypothetical protein VHT75_04635 [Acidimicrobiales bacterium]|nr:hypothetical protein [Acidimicrobiales bacterium]
MPTPVGPAPRDPNDPDFWDWEAPDDVRLPGRRPLRPVIAVLIGLVVVLIILRVIVG